MVRDHAKEGSYSYHMFYGGIFRYLLCIRLSASLVGDLFSNNRELIQN